MVNLLDIHVEPVTPESVKEYDRVVMVDVQPHYFGGAIDRADLIIDHHPEQPGYTSVFRDIRPDYGSTSTILTEHLRAVDVSISERTATAMLYAIKSDTLFFNRQTNRVDIEAFSLPLPRSPTRRSSGRWKARKSRASASTTCSRRTKQGPSPIRCLRIARRVAARRLHPVRRGLLPAARRRQVDRHRGHRQRHDVGVRAQPGVHEERGRVRAAMVRGHRQRGRPSGDGQGGDAACRRSERSSAIWPTRP